MCRVCPEQIAMSQGEDLFGITFEKGEIVFSQGDMGDTMYIIQSGAVEISQSQNGIKVVLALLERGGFFGEMALIDNHPRSASATAISRSRLLPLTRSSLTERIRHDPGVVVHLLKTLCERINDTNLMLKTKIQNDERLRFFLESTRRETEETGRQVMNDRTAEQYRVSRRKKVYHAL